MTGFFLTFRDYLTPIRLCKLLILRFRWALKDDSDARRLVRIRTFVVLRYWISHYWEHDFKDARPLRFMLCTFLSKVRSHPLIQTSPRDDRIVHQLRHLLKLQKKKYHSPSHGSLDSASITLDSDNPLQPKKRERQVSATSSASIPFSVLTNTTSSPRHSMQESWHLGLQSIKRTLPSVCHSLVQNLSPPTKPADRDSALFHHDQCSCSATPRHQRRISNKWALPERWFSSLSASPSIPSADEPCPLHPKSSANLPAQPLRRPLDRRPRPLSHPHHAQPPHQRQQHRASYYSEGAVSDGSVRSKGTITSLPAMLTLDLAADPPTKSSYQSLVLIYRSETIAQQFTLLEQQMLQHVTWNELVDLRWRKRSKGTVLSPDLPLQHGVEQLIGFFNKTCQWVSSEIVRTQSIGKRARVIAKFIRIAMKCHQHKNYSTLMQILLGLQSPWVTRLERTWQRVGQFEMQAFGELKELAKPFRNWKNVREAMTLVTQDIDEASALEAVLSQQHHTTTLPGCIPFLGKP
ncbi:ras GEF [Hesseltinella vesiculosa]|uniref:Ras GEF n=1 Tax=Hesseltinella vesiculosa TaxID=101127 RepID=A0A1X2G3I0_9FUNG|nr:ras GEF [Hesseltinella vesiculosa]